MVLPASVCPYCEKLLDAAGALDKDTTPKPGDASICVYCAQMLIFNHKLVLRKPHADEIAMIRKVDPEAMAEIELLQHVVRSMDRRDIHE